MSFKLDTMLDTFVNPNRGGNNACLYNIYEDSFPRAAQNDGVGMIEVDDGFKPEPSSATTRIVKTAPGIGSGTVVVLDGALPDDVAREVYDYTCGQKVPWGAYVARDDVLGEEVDSTDTTREYAVARKLLRHFFRGKAHHLITPDDNGGRVHGFSVWALGNVTSNYVAYHMDYAEQYRLATNIIHPPLLGVTLQVSPFKNGDIQGGVFAVNVDGPGHYARLGHQNRLVSEEYAARDFKESSSWVKVPYRYNRAIVFDGILPHCSTRVDRVPAGMKRVIVGINLFDQQIGPRVSLCSIHTRAFKRAEKLRATMNQVMSFAGLSSAQQSLGKYGNMNIMVDDGDDDGSSSSSSMRGGLDLASLGSKLKDMDKQSSEYRFLARLAQAAKATAEAQRVGAEKKNQGKDTANWSAAAIVATTTTTAAATAIATAAPPTGLLSNTSTCSNSASHNNSCGSAMDVKAVKNLEKQAFRCVMRDDTAGLATLLARGVDVNCRNAGTHTLLEMAVERRRPGVAALLQERGAEIDHATLSICQQED